MGVDVTESLRDDVTGHVGLELTSKGMGCFSDGFAVRTFHCVLTLLIFGSLLVQDTGKSDASPPFEEHFPYFLRTE